jgi:hypothetical protein
MASTNIIDSVQQLFAGLATFSGKPSALWLGPVWPTYAGSFTNLPFIQFNHDGTEDETDFEYTQLEMWPFTFEIRAETAQQCILIHDRVKLNGQNPEAQAGFRYAATMTMPPGYSFKEFRPVGKWRINPVPAQTGPSGAPLHLLTFQMELHVQRVTFS